MSTNGDVLRCSEVMGSQAQAQQLEISWGTNDWNPEDFGREQIRGLVRRVFFASGGQPVTQVVFSAADPHTEVAGICDQVGQALALETSAHIAVVGREPRAGETVREHSYDVRKATMESPVDASSIKSSSTKPSSTKPSSIRSSSIKSWSTQKAVNLWRVPGFGLREWGEESGTGRYWQSCLAELRNEFEYAVIEGPAAGISSEAGLLGQLTDGIILVLGAHSTRRATARKIKETLEAAQSRILGTVLSERRFPVPERIYRRL
jgi:hypothetical protein